MEHLGGTLALLGVFSAVVHMFFRDIHQDLGHPDDLVSKWFARYAQWLTDRKVWRIKTLSYLMIALGAYLAGSPVIAVVLAVLTIALWLMQELWPEDSNGEDNPHP